MKDSTLSSRLRIAAKNAKVSQRDLADLLNISTSAVNQWFQGKTAPSSIGIGKVAHYLGVDVHWLLTGEGEKTTPLRELHSDETEETEKLLEERALTHGDAHKTFTLAGDLMTSVLMAKDGCHVTPHEFAIINILHKVARIICGSYSADHWDDIKGYAELGNCEQNKQNELKNEP